MPITSLSDSLLGPRISGSSIGSALSAGPEASYYGDNQFQGALTGSDLASQILGNPSGTVQRDPDGTMYSTGGPNGSALTEIAGPPQRRPISQGLLDNLNNIGPIEERSPVPGSTVQGGGGNMYNGRGIAEMTPMSPNIDRESLSSAIAAIIARKRPGDQPIYQMPEPGLGTTPLFPGREGSDLPLQPGGNKAPIPTGGGSAGGGGAPSGGGGAPRPTGTTTAAAAAPLAATPAPYWAPPSDAQVRASGTHGTVTIPMAALAARGGPMRG